MKSYRKIGLFTICGICCLLASNLYGAIFLYDDFSKPLLDANKWAPTEFVREIDPVQGKLISKVRGYSDQDGFLRNNLGVNYSAPLTEIKARINVVAGDLSLGNNTRILARAGGYFYNTQISGTAGLGNVWAEIDIIEAGNGLAVIYQIEEQLTSDINGQYDVTEGIIATSGALQYGVIYEVKIEYNSDNQFIFSVTGPGLTTISNTVYGPARTRNSTSNSVNLATGIDSDGPGNYGYISAIFDDVYVNTVLYDNFSSSSLQPSKWPNNEFVREVSGGKLRLNAQGTGSTATSAIGPLKKSNFLQAKALIESGSWVQNTTGFVRLASYFYNDSRGPGSGLPYDGELGNVWVTIRIILNQGGNLTAYAGVFRVDDPSFTTDTELLWEAFPTQILFDTEYTLSMEFTGSQLILKCDNDMLTYDILTNIFPPSDNYRSIQSRVNSGGSGYMRCQVDDVYDSRFDEASNDLVTKYYNDILDRAPEPAGFVGWTSEIERIFNIGIDIKEGFGALSKFFFNSDEYLLKSKTDEQYVIDLYQVFFSRTPAQTEIAYWIGQGLTRNVLLNWFVYSLEFPLYMAGIFGNDAGRPECNLINDFYRGLLNRLPDTDGFNAYVAMMTTAMATSQQAVKDLSYAIASGFLNSAEYTLRNRDNLEFLEDLYNGILRRGAVQDELDYWSNWMVAGHTRDEVLFYFVNSAEFQLRVQAIIDSM